MQMPGPRDIVIYWPGHFLLCKSPGAGHTFWCKSPGVPGGGMVTGQIDTCISWHIAKPLAQIVNLSFYVGMFPSKLKVGKVSPLHKTGSCDNPSNYRPISILSVFSKIFEKLMHQRLYKFLESFEIYTHYSLVLEKKTFNISCSSVFD